MGQSPGNPLYSTLVPATSLLGDPECVTQPLWASGFSSVKSFPSLKGPARTSRADEQKAQRSPQEAHKETRKLGGWWWRGYHYVCVCRIRVRDVFLSQAYGSTDDLPPSPSQ